MSESAEGRLYQLSIKKGPAGPFLTSNYSTTLRYCVGGLFRSLITVGVFNGHLPIVRGS